MRKLTDSQIRDIAKTLIGSTLNLSDVLPEGLYSDDLSIEDLEELDSSVLMCEMCGGWSSPDEMTDDVCNECVIDPQ